MTSPPKNNALGDPAADDLNFLANFDEYNTAWPDYQDFQSTGEDGFGGSFLDGAGLGRLPAGMVSPTGHKTPVTAALASSTWSPHPILNGFLPPGAEQAAAAAPQSALLQPAPQAAPQQSAQQQSQQSQQQQQQQQQAAGPSRDADWSAQASDQLQQQEMDNPIAALQAQYSSILQQQQQLLLLYNQLESKREELLRSHNLPVPAGDALGAAAGALVAASTTSSGQAGLPTPASMAQLARQAAAAAAGAGGSVGGSRGSALPGQLAGMAPRNALPLHLGLVPAAATAAAGAALPSSSAWLQLHGLTGLPGLPAFQGPSSSSGAGKRAAPSGGTEDEAACKKIKLEAAGSMQPHGLQGQPERSIAAALAALQQQQQLGAGLSQLDAANMQMQRQLMMRMLSAQTGLPLDSPLLAAAAAAAMASSHYGGGWPVGSGSGAGLMMGLNAASSSDATASALKQTAGMQQQAAEQQLMMGLAGPHPFLQQMALVEGAILQSQQQQQQQLLAAAQLQQMQVQQQLQGAMQHQAATGDGGQQHQHGLYPMAQHQQQQQQQQQQHRQEAREGGDGTPATDAQGVGDSRADEGPAGCNGMSAAPTWSTQASSKPRVARGTCHRDADEPAAVHMHNSSSRTASGAGLDGPAADVTPAPAAAAPAPAAEALPAPAAAEADVTPEAAGDAPEPAAAPPAAEGEATAAAAAVVAAEAAAAAASACVEVETPAAAAAPPAAADTGGPAEAVQVTGRAPADSSLDKPPGAGMLQVAPSMPGALDAAATAAGSGGINPLTGLPFLPGMAGLPGGMPGLPGLPFGHHFLDPVARMLAAAAAAGGLVGIPGAGSGLAGLPPGGLGFPGASLLSAPGAMGPAGAWGANQLLSLAAAAGMAEPSTSPGHLQAAMAAAAAAAAAASGADGSSGLLPPAFALAALLQQQQQQQQRQQQQQQQQMEQQPVLSGGGSRVDAYPQWQSGIGAGLAGAGSRGNSAFGQTPSTLGAMFGLPMVGTSKQLVSSSSAQEASLPPLHPGTLACAPLQQQQQHKLPHNPAPVTSEEQQLVQDVRYLASSVQPEVRAELQHQLHRLANESLGTVKPRAGHAPPLKDVTRTAVDAVRRCVHTALQRGQPSLLLQQQSGVASPRLGAPLLGQGLLGGGAGAFGSSSLQQAGDGLGMQQLMGQPLMLQEAGLLLPYLGMGLQ